MRLAYVVRAALLGTALFSGLPRPAAACGGGGVTSASSGVLANTQRIFMSVRAATTEVVVQIGVPATTAEYGVLIPVPSEPTLDPQPIAQADLDVLDRVTAPMIYVAEPDSGGSTGCGCGSTGEDKAGAGGQGVTVSAPVNVGPVEAIVLSADDSDALAAWLTGHGFALSDDEQALVAAYATAGSYFIAIRRSDTAATGSPTSIGLHYTLAGAHKKLSLGFARLGAAAQVSFTLFFAAQQTMAPAPPFTPLTLDELDANLLRDGAYTTAVAEAVAAHDAKAFVIERTVPKNALPKRTVPPSTLPTIGPALLDLIDDGATVTRLSTVVAAEALHDDATFTGPYTGTVPGQRYVSASLSRPRIAMAGVPALGLVALLRWRRRRR
jgi:hypothetical protein